MIYEIKFLKIKVHLGTQEEILAKIKFFLNNNKNNLVVTLNPEMVVRAQNDVWFNHIINSADLVIPDGIGIIKAISCLKKTAIKPARITGVDLIYLLARLFKDKGRFFLFGGEKDVAKKVASNLIKLCPDIDIISTQAGYDFKSEDLISEINKSEANILLVALGSPKQEKWIARYLEKMPSVRIAVGVGGAFDFISGRVKRAPLWMRNIGIEWLWRLLRQPWRIARIYKAVVIFPLLVIKEKFFRSP